MSDLTTKTMEALKAIGDAISSSDRGAASVFIGLSGNYDINESEGESGLPLPRIEVEAQKGQEEESGTGNYWMDCEIRILSSGNEPVATHNARAKNVEDAFNSDVIEASLSTAVSGFTCMGIMDRDGGDQKKEGSVFTTPFKFKALCCQADF